ncbi:MAG: hypothetical protein U0822_21460 [Anaerolineae bacterium]
MPQPEQRARQTIDRLLADAGWLVQDRGQINLGANRGVAVREFPVKTGFAANLARAKHLRQSILKRAFAGQLVPQDPSDEPASALLEQIRRPSPQPSPTGRGGPRGPEGATQGRLGI